MFFHFAYQRRDNQYSSDEPCCERDGQNEHFVEQFATFKLMADGYTGEQHHQHHSHHILYYQDTCGTLDETLILHACLVDGLHHNGGARHTKHTRQEKGIDHIKLGIRSHEIAQYHHSTDDGHCAYCRHLAAADEVLQTELQSDAEQDEQHADIAPSLYVSLIYDSLTKEMRTYQYACNDISQHHRLLYQLKQYTDHSGRNHQNV